MALSLGSSIHQEVRVDVDDLTIVLALLALLTEQMPEDEPVLGVANRVCERLREDMSTLDLTACQPTRSRRSTR